jgi:hypothetical protein
MDHLDLKLRGLWKIKKFAGDGENFLALPCCDAVSGQIEKSDSAKKSRWSVARPSSLLKSSHGSSGAGCGTFKPS